MVIIGFIYSLKGRSPASVKVSKILNWERYNNLTKGRAFLGVCIYYRI
jgi:hypothetical protein